MKIFAALLLAGSVAACHGCNQLPPAMPDFVVVDGGRVVDTELSPADISAACTNMRALQCPDGLPSPGGVTCEQYMATAGSFFDLKAIAAAKSLADLAQLNVRCVP